MYDPNVYENEVPKGTSFSYMVGREGFEELLNRAKSVARERERE